MAMVNDRPPLNEWRSWTTLSDFVYLNDREFVYRLIMVNSTKCCPMISKILTLAMIDS